MSFRTCPTCGGLTSRNSQETSPEEENNRENDEFWRQVLALQQRPVSYPEYDQERYEQEQEEENEPFWLRSAGSAPILMPSRPVYGTYDDDNVDYDLLGCGEESCDV